jgi:YggT family protein
MFFAILQYVLVLYLLVFLVRIVLSWFPLQPGSFMNTVQDIAITLTEPVLGPIRRVVPPLRLGAMALDLSPLIVIFGLQILIALIP